MENSHVSNMKRCAKLSTEEQRAKAREHQRKWREKLKLNVSKDAEYREMQKERTRVWKEKMRCDGERYEELSKKHQERCKKWWEKLTPEQRREKRKQYNMKWRQNQKKTDEDPTNTKVNEEWQYKSFSEVMMENQSGPKPPPEYYPKSARFKIPFKEEPLHRNNWILSNFPYGDR